MGRHSCVIKTMPVNLNACHGANRDIDLGKRSFLPTNGTILPIHLMDSDPNVPSVRELVRMEQARRTTPIGDKFARKMEDNLMRWKPSVSSHNGTVLYVEGNHPYQLPTSEYNKKSKFKTYPRKFSISGATTTNNSNLINNSIQSWWKGEGQIQDCKLQDINNVNFSKNGSFDLGFEIEMEMDVDFKKPIEMEENINFTSNHESTTILTPYVLPYKSPKLESNKYVKNEINDLGIDDVEQRQLYEEYYGMALPSNYLDTLKHYQTQQQQKNQSYRNAQKGVEENTHNYDWLTVCWF